MMEESREIYDWLLRGEIAAIGDYWRGQRLYGVTKTVLEWGFINSISVALHERNIIRALN